jgi:hypothetical protein
MFGFKPPRKVGQSLERIHEQFEIFAAVGMTLPQALRRSDGRNEEYSLRI